MRIREVKTASGKHALQVVSKRYGKLTVHKHIGSYATDSEKERLYQQAYDFINKTSGQLSISGHLAHVTLSDIAITQSKPLFAYQLLSDCYDKLGFSNYKDSLIKDIIIARIYQPASKLKLQGALHESFGRYYGKRTIYRHLKHAIANGIQETFQKALIAFARTDLHDPLRLVFYDVTTLYFESNIRTALKDFGFSKDHRPLDTQIVIGLVVNKEGFPLYFDVFKGNTFEGHTFIPVVKNIQKLLETKELIIVADAAMISQDNIEKLDGADIGFIVGARLGNLPPSLIETITTALKKTDGEITTVLYRNHRLICSYSVKRAAKDKSDRQKQVAKAKQALATPSGVTRRFRFLKSEGNTFSVNTDLVSKAEKLEGIKGYVTNTDLDATTIVERYHDLWRIEKSFRITKSDLEARPIFHHLDETIKVHMVIVFAGLALAKYLEIRMSMSIEKILHIASRVLTHTIINTKTGESIEKETTIEDDQLQLVIERLRALGH